MKLSYSPSEFIKNCWSLFCTKLFFRPARLIRRPVYIRGRKGMRFGAGFTTGYRCRFELFNWQDGVKLTIANNCKIGNDVQITASKSVTIGDDCWLGGGVIVLPGVTIGARSIIGAGSVVTKDIPEDCVAVGNPCRIIKEKGVFL